MRFSHHHENLHPASRRRPSAAQKGYVLVMFALLLVPMLLVAGLSVDVGAWYDRASDIRKAADAAALAGVVWLPDEGVATTHARTAAERNGFKHGTNGIVVAVDTSDVSQRRIRVTITDPHVGSFFWGNLGGRDISLTRTSFAEYVLAVPMGSPRNFIGTGLLLEPAGTGFANEELYMSVNPYCTDRVNGDRFQSHSQGGTCSGTANQDYDPLGYATYIEVPKNPLGAIDVMLYDARYNEDATPTGETVTNCTAWQWPSNWTTVNWNGPRTFTVGEQTQYQRRSNFRSNSGGFQNQVTLDPNTYTVENNYGYRYRTRFRTCTPTPVMEDAIDDFRQSGKESYTFTLQTVDNTPLNDSDNPIICSKIYEHDTPFDGGKYLGSVRWNKLCTITAPEEGRYILRVRNGGQVTSPQGDGSNQYGVVARYQGAALPGLCDGRNDNTCPRVFGKESLSVRAASSADIAQFFLAEIDAEHDGKTLELELFDPGEGGRFIRILRPTGANSWTPVDFSWASPGVSGSPGTTNNLSVRSGTTDRFNGRLLTIQVPLNNYNPPSNNRWWKIEYEFSGSAVTDRTTWGARVLGDPIHLVEEF